MVKTFQYLLIGWFILINLFIFVPSFLVLCESWSETDSTTQKAPEFPTAPTFVVEPLNTSLDPESQKKQIEALTQRVIAFTQQVTLYTQQVNAYKAYGDTANKSRRLETYKTVVKDSLVSLFSTLLTALVGYVFAKGGVELVNNYIRAKNNQTVEPIKFW